MSLKDKQKIRLVISFTLSVVFGGLLTSLLFFPVPPQNADIIKVLVGFIGGAYVTMIAYYFGDSDGKE